MDELRSQSHSNCLCEPTTLVSGIWGFLFRRRAAAKFDTVELENVGYTKS